MHVPDVVHLVMRMMSSPGSSRADASSSSTLGARIGSLRPGQVERFASRNTAATGSLFAARAPLVSERGRAGRAGAGERRAGCKNR